MASAPSSGARLETAQHRNQLESELRRLERYHLLVVVEVGYLPLKRQVANLLFALGSHRYERDSPAVFGNRGFDQSGEPSATQGSPPSCSTDSSTTPP